MIRTVISHDPTTTRARIRFEHAGVTLEDDFSLDCVLPGSKLIFAQLGMDFDEEKQLRAMDKLTESIERQIDSGAIKNPPEAS